MPTYHDDLDSFVNEQLQDSLYFKCYYEYFRKLKGSFFTQWYVDMIMQPSHYHPLDICQAAHFAQIHSALGDGRMLFTAIGPTKDTPFRDSAVEENNKALSNLTHPFSAKFIGGTGIGDGWLEWTDSIIVESANREDIYRSATLEPSCCVLEVGYTRPTTTLLHLFQNRRVARWPYGHNVIYLLVVVDRNLWTSTYEIPEEITKRLLSRPVQLSF